MGPLTQEEDVTSDHSPTERQLARIPQEARAGLLRAFIDVLHSRHPHATWLSAATQGEVAREAS